MGQDKALLVWNDTSLLEHMTQLLSTVATSVRVVGKSELPDKIPGKGPLGGILTGLEITEQAANLFLAVDLPLLTQDFLKLFLSRFLASRKPLQACRVSRDYPLCLGIQRSLLPTIKQRVESNVLSIRSLIEESNAEILDEGDLKSLGFDCGMFANLNTPQEWRRYSKERP